MRIVVPWVLVASVPLATGCRDRPSDPIVVDRNLQLSIVALPDGAFELRDCETGQAIAPHRISVTNGAGREVCSSPLGALPRRWTLGEDWIRAPSGQACLSTLDGRYEVGGSFNVSGAKAAVLVRDGVVRLERSTPCPVR